MKSMANRIELALRNKNGGNQSELARFIGVSPQAVQKWVSGEAAPKGDNLKKAAEFLGVSAAYLQFGELARAPDPTTAEQAPQGQTGQLDPDVLTGIIQVLRHLTPDHQRLALSQVQNIGLAAASRVPASTDNVK